MPISEQQYFRATRDALKVIREDDAPKYIKEKLRVCINCMHWDNYDTATGFCKCKGILAPFKKLRTWYSDTCCYCYIKIWR